MRKTIKTLLVAFVMGFLLTESVAAVPGIPHQLYGTVTINNLPAPDGTAVSAKVAEDVYTTFTSGGKFGYSPNVFFVEDPDGNRATKTIQILVNNKLVANLTFSNNGYTQLNLSTETFCGDNFCLGSETHASCSLDCPIDNAVPPSNTNTGGGGSSSRRNRQIDVCVENWQCTEWGECNILGTQKRTCSDVNNCGTTILKPLETRDCPEEQTPLTLNTNGQEEPKKGFFSWITGAVIGAGGATNTSIFILIIALIIAAVFIRAKMGKKSSSAEN
ncbi:hypothetical protein HYV50_02395 [Candidatus Pacearchaeota archaeon]|nr:hypothetical protein [Candidatus Pacearchaeota archaeon]